MKIIGIMAVVILIIVAIALVVLWQYGLFKPVQVIEKGSGKYTLVYKKHLGDYKDVGPVMDELYHDIKTNYNLDTTKGFGLYYDNPQEVKKKKLRSIVGCIIDEHSASKLNSVKEKYKVREYPSSKSIIVEFPYKGMLSIIIGVFKVYPILSAYIREHNYNNVPIMEIYDQPNKKIRYISSVNLPGKVFAGFLD